MHLVPAGLVTRLLRDALTTSANICLLGHCSTNDSLHEEPYTLNSTP